MARPSALTLMVLTEFGSIYRLCRKTEKDYKTAKARCKESDSTWQTSRRTYCFGGETAPKYILLRNDVLMTSREDETVVQIVPQVATDWVKQLLYSAYEKESELKESITKDENRVLDDRRLNIYPCSLNLQGDLISFTQGYDDSSSDSEEE